MTYTEYCETNGLCKFCEWDLADTIPDEVEQPDSENEIQLKNINFGVFGKASSTLCLYRHKLHIGIFTDQTLLDENIKINYCPMCGRKLGKE